MIAVFHSPLNSPLVSDKFTMVVIESRHGGNISLSVRVGTVSILQDLDFINIMVLYTCLLVSGAKLLNGFWLKCFMLLNFSHIFFIFSKKYVANSQLRLLGGLFGNGLSLLLVSLLISLRRPLVSFWLSMTFCVMHCFFYEIGVVCCTCFFL